MQREASNQLLAIKLVAIIHTLVYTILKARTYQQNHIMDVSHQVMLKLTVEDMMIMAAAFITVSL